MIGHSGLTAKHGKVTDNGTARQADLSCKDGMAPDFRVMGDLHLVINHGAITDHGIAKGTAVDRGIGANPDIITDDNPPDMRKADGSIR